MILRGEELQSFTAYASLMASSGEPARAELIISPALYCSTMLVASLLFVLVLFVELKKYDIKNPERVRLAAFKIVRHFLVLFALFAVIIYFVLNLVGLESIKFSQAFLACYFTSNLILMNRVIDALVK